MLLIKKHCVDYKGDARPLPKKDAQGYLTEIPLWTLHQKSIEREIRFKDFKQSMDFIRKLADLAEEEGHHPDINVLYNRVRLQLSTHSIGGLSENDFILAAKIDRLLTS